MTLRYTLKFYDYWHVSSGLSAGSRLDSSVIKTSDGLPYVAGKIIKGLTRETAELLENHKEFVALCFGDEGSDMGKCYFSNAILKKETADQITTNKLQNNLYDIIASTKISQHGIAVDDSLREIEVVVPLTLCGEIKDIPNQENYKKMTNALKMIKRMGLNRNRGLGRCAFIIEEQI